MGSLLFILAAVVGLAVGSFLNVVIYRLPRGESLWGPASHCPSCSSPVRWYDNIPVVSFFLLRGRCRSCKEPISWRYPLVEGVCAFFFLIIFRHNFSGVNFYFFSLFNVVRDALFVCLLIPIFFIDLEHQIIPDSLSYTLIAVGCFSSGVGGNLTTSLVGAGIGVGIFLLILCLSLILLHQPGMGIGDVKMAAGIGAFLGWKLAFLSFFFSFLTGALVAGVLLLFRLKEMRDRVSFGPFLVTGALLSFFLGERIIRFYFALIW